jgi:ParB-like chromosome segregation protein Spo0J
MTTSASKTPTASEPDLSQVEWVPIRALRPNPRNARTHSKKQLRQIAASLRNFGFLNPIIADDGNVVLAGHGRLEAARLNGMEKAPVLRFSHLSEVQKRAYVLADNRIAENAGWDREMLSIELGELVEFLPVEGLEVSLTGFEVAEIDLLLADMAAPKIAPEDALPALREHAISRRGDLWRLGRHRLLCGDARNAADLAVLMDGTLAPAVFCDPPYNVAVKSIGGRGRTRHREFAFASGEMSRGEYRDFLKETLANGARVSRPGAVHYVCMDWRHIGDLSDVGAEVYGGMLNLIVWNKSNAGQGSFYRSKHELIGVFRVGDGQHRNNVELGRFGRNRANVWDYPGVNAFGKGRDEALASHPTVKPVALVADAMLDSTAPGEIVLDQFAGSARSSWRPKRWDGLPMAWNGTRATSMSRSCDGSAQPSSKRRY